jgi:uncharacterized protein YceK
MINLQTPTHTINAQISFFFFFQPTCARQKIEFLLETLIRSRRAHPRGSTTCSSVTPNNISSPGEQRPSNGTGTQKKTLDTYGLPGTKALSTYDFPGANTLDTYGFPATKNLVMMSAKLNL